MKIISIAFISVIAFTSCDSVLLGDDDGVPSREENLATPPFLQDGLAVASMDDEGVDGQRIRELIAQLQTDSRNIHSILILKNNKLVVESYFGGWHRNRFQSLRSATKSVTSALIGIAIDQNYLKNDEVKIFDIFSEYGDLRTEAKETIQLNHILSMSAGLQWDQTRFPDDDPRNDEAKLSESDDGFRYTLEKKYVATPGTLFNYSSGNSDLLAGVIHHTSGSYAHEFAERFLFAPLQIDDYGWRMNRNGHPNAGFGLHLYPRDIMKIGKLFLDSGAWNGRQIISKAWIKKSTSKQIAYPQDPKQFYGYQWWIREWSIQGEIFYTFQAQGNGGQVLCIIPEKRAVILLTGGNYGERSQVPYALLRTHLLPAL
ncbi:serine hydrolase domain-containing protein [Pseudochryseolinea flava]|uniref:Beta-lactamase-related domain-containing protein n=1 Tax=Pseudochryseolinea flava TaxID=2059302 RepID=A0A364Y7B3_9BACT|nr:serine hydrolase [Pseudochryseolinea flava]RAW02867.1 hypothetical protein DQQ10_01800 [Pseudochryseolinea flava]